jgi:serine phosphatase RsbU (regulator of sigma subunit)
MALLESIQMHSAPVELIDTASLRSVPIDRFPFTIGRASDSCLALPQAYISRHHAEIVREGILYVLNDPGSRHGTFVNGKQITRHLLVPMDTLQFGSLDGPQFRFAPADTVSSTQTNLLSRLRGVGSVSSDLEKLRWFLEAVSELNNADKIDRILTSLLQATLTLTRMERGYVFLSSEKGALEFARGIDTNGALEEDGSSVSRTIIRQAAEGVDQFILTDNLTADRHSLPESIVAQNIRSVICIPLRQTRGNAADLSKRPLLGLLYIDSRFHPGRFAEMDHELLRSIAREAAVLIENTQLNVIEDERRQYRKELQIAAGIQRGLMPVQPPMIAYAAVEAHCEACSAVGGDFFDIISSDGTINAVLVDVSGKGISAAILASTLQGMLYTHLQARGPLAAIADALNSYLCAKSVGKYATMILLRLHADGALEYLNCGHVEPRVNIGGTVSKLEVSNMPIGLIPGAAYSAATVQLLPGSWVMVVSDGVTEAENAEGEFFGEERLDVAACCATLDQFIQAMRDFCAGHPATDDCTVLRIAFKG